MTRNLDTLPAGDAGNSNWSPTMRLPIIAAALACLALPAIAQDVDGERWPCHQFEGVGMTGTLTLSEDWSTATMEAAGETTRYDLASCGTGTLSYCGRNPAQADDTAVFAFITGYLSATEGSPRPFVLVDGLWEFEPMCEE